MATNSIDVALWYASEKNCSVIPVRGDKRPLIKWEQYQKERATEKQIKDWFQKWPDAMIGIVTGSISGLSVIDIDTEEGFKEIDKLIPDSILMPTSQTPKGGKHLYFQSPEKIISNNSRIIPGCDFRGEGGYIIAPPSVNANKKHYKWVDGRSIADVALPALPDAYLRALASNNKNINYKGCRQHGDSSLKMFDLGRRDNDLFHIANQLVKSNTPKQEIFQVLENLILSWGEEPDPKWISTKIESALKRSSRRERTLAEEVKDFVSSTTGVFSSSEISNCLQLSSRAEKQNLSKILGRLCDKGEIEKYGTKNGVFRLVNNECEDINFLDAPEDSIDIKWPFAIEELVKTLPKNIIIVAGEPNAGKTAFLLNVVKMNMDNHDIQYFSSEMGSIEMRERLSKFNLPLEQWKFTPKERVSDFADVIKPNSINIIDFLEIYDEFYKISGLIKEIFDKLDKGIAVIAIQKNKGNEFGLGGMRTMEKARLYLTMEPNKIKIVKAKNWSSTHENPNNMEMDFKLIQGCQFKEKSFWKKINNQDTPKKKY